MAHVENIIVRPLITEKSSVIGDQFNKYGFEVNLKANKFQIKNAVEKLYDVKVLDVQTNIRPGKTKRFGMFTKKTAKIKKAFVKLAPGQKIEFFKGV